MFLYRNILRQSWGITWRHKYLWFFGVFVALLGSSGEYDILRRGLAGDVDKVLFPAWRGIVQTGVFSRNSLDTVGQMMTNDPASLLILSFLYLVILVLFVFLIWLAAVSQGGLVNNAAGIIRNKKADFKSGMTSGIKNFWPVLILSLLIKIIVSLAFVFISLPLLFMKNNTLSASLLYVLFFIIFIPLAIGLSFMIKYAIAYTVIKSCKFRDSLARGWRLFKDNWLISFEMALILFAINLLAGLAILLAILILAVPFLFLALIFYYLSSILGFWLIALLALISFLAIIIAGGSMVTVFQITSWTGLFLELEANGGRSKIVRLLGGIVK